MYEKRDPDIELAWAAGFFDGEGCVHVHRRDQIVQLQVGQTEETTLQRFAKAVGLGNVTGPYDPKRRNSNVYWRWQVYGTKAEAVMAKLLPHMSAPKSLAFADAMEAIRGV